MKINKRERDGVIILEVEGKVTIGKGDVVLRETVHEAIGDGRSQDADQPRTGHARSIRRAWASW